MKKFTVVCRLEDYDTLHPIYTVGKTINGAIRTAKKMFRNSHGRESCKGKEVYVEICFEGHAKQIEPFYKTPKF